MVLLFFQGTLVYSAGAAPFCHLPEQDLNIGHSVVHSSCAYPSRPSSLYMCVCFRILMCVCVCGYLQAGSVKPWTGIQSITKGDFHVPPSCLVWNIKLCVIPWLHPLVRFTSSWLQGKNHSDDSEVMPDSHLKLKLNQHISLSSFKLTPGI